MTPYQHAVIEQYEWIVRCGRSRIGYVYRYHILNGDTIEQALTRYDADVKRLNTLILCVMVDNTRRKA